MNLNFLPLLVQIDQMEGGFFLHLHLQQNSESLELGKCLLCGSIYMRMFNKLFILLTQNAPFNT